MSEQGRFYWLKLKVNFMTSETVDFLMSQDGGANYIVLYQMLCLKTINTGGRLSRQIGEVIIPFDEAKIQRDCKWFSIDTIRVAMQLYKKLGLIYEDVDGTLVIADHQSLIGSEGASAQRMRRMRGKETPPMLQEGETPSHCDASCDAECDKIVTTEIEYRDRDRYRKKENINTIPPRNNDTEKRMYRTNEGRGENFDFAEGVSGDGGDSERACGAGEAESRRAEGTAGRGSGNPENGVRGTETLNWRDLSTAQGRLH